MLSSFEAFTAFLKASVAPDTPIVTGGGWEAALAGRFSSAWPQRGLHRASSGTAEAGPGVACRLRSSREASSNSSVLDVPARSRARGAGGQLPAASAATTGGARSLAQRARGAFGRWRISNVSEVSSPSSRRPWNRIHVATVG